jgi:hypothetical protein
LLCKFAEKRRKGSTNETGEGSPELFLPSTWGIWKIYYFTSCRGNIQRTNSHPVHVLQKEKERGVFCTKTLQKIFVIVILKVYSTASN